MQSLTLQQLFGKNVSQDGEDLNICKSDLPSLTVSNDNRAEQLLVALIIQAWQEFEGILVDNTGEALVDEMGETVSFDQRELYEKLNIWFWRRQIVNTQILDTFVINVFINPPIPYDIVLSANQL